MGEEIDEEEDAGGVGHRHPAEGFRAMKRPNTGPGGYENNRPAQKFRFEHPIAEKSKICIAEKQKSPIAQKSSFGSKRVVDHISELETLVSSHKLRKSYEEQLRKQEYKDLKEDYNREALKSFPSHIYTPGLFTSPLTKYIVAKE